MKKLLVTGATGMLGGNLIDSLQERSDIQYRALGSKDCDLRSLANFIQILQDERPDVVVHFAGVSGGLGANRERPASYFYDNVLLVSNAFEACACVGIKRLIVPVGSCSYPNNSITPIHESQIWTGYPQEDSAAYATAKKLALVAAQAYCKEHGLQVNPLILGNVYGKYDNFRPSESHVVPAIIRKMTDAKARGLPTVSLWGDGAAVRDFVFAQDIAEVILEIVVRDLNTNAINISSGRGTSILKLAELIQEETGYAGSLEWQKHMPQGQKDKTLNVTYMKSVDLDCPTSLRDGIRKTVAWFLKSQLEGADNLRI